MGGPDVCGNFLRADLVHDILIVIKLIGSNAWTRLHHRGHVVVPLLALLGLVPIDRPSKVSGVDV